MRSGAGNARDVPLNDHVLRRKRFEREHPAAVFVPPCEHDPRWKVKPGDGTELAALNLGLVMDKLDLLFPPPDELDAGQRGHVTAEGE